MIPPKSWRGGGAVVSALRGLPPLSGPMPCSPHVQDGDLGMTCPSHSAAAEPRPLSPRFRAGGTPGTLGSSVPWGLGGSGCHGHPGGRGRLGGPQVCTELAWLLTERACSRSFSPTPQVRQVKLWVPTGLITTGWHVPSVCARGHGPRPSCGSRTGPEAAPRLRLEFIPPSPGGWNPGAGGAGPSRGRPPGRADGHLLAVSSSLVPLCVCVPTSLPVRTPVLWG